MMRIRTFKECNATVGRNSYITIGKWYKVKEHRDNWIVVINDDFGRENSLLLSSCAHLDGGNWEIER